MKHALLNTTNVYNRYNRNSSIFDLKHQQTFKLLQKKNINNRFTIQKKNPQFSHHLPFLEFLTTISQPPFSWNQPSNPSHSLSSTKKLKFPKSTTNFISQSSKPSNSEEIQHEESRIMVRQLKLTRTFRSIKPHSTPNPNPKIEIENVAEIEGNCSKVSSSSWCVYLIASTNPPLKTYVGVTNDFTRRLKQHNGELKGGAKASRAGRPWVCACLIQGFRSQSEACEFESKWKIISRKMPRKHKSEDNEGLEDKGRLMLLQHRHAAMEKLKHSFDSDHLQVDWQLSPF